MTARFHKTPGVAFQIGPARSLIPGSLVRTLLGAATFGTVVATLLAVRG